MGCGYLSSPESYSWAVALISIVTSEREKCSCKFNFLQCPSIHELGKYNCFHFKIIFKYSQILSKLSYFNNSMLGVFEYNIPYWEEG